MNPQLQNLANRNQDFYGYVLNFSALAAAANSTGTFQIDQDSDFLLQKMTMVADIAGAAITNSSMPVPLATMQVTDGGSSRSLFSAAAPLGAVFGNGMEPFILPAPRYIAAGSSISVALTNYSAATSYNIRLVFAGIRFYKR